MQTHCPQPHPRPEPGAPTPGPDQPVPAPGPADTPEFTECHDDPEQAEELERQQDA